MGDPLLTHRADFPILASTNYLISNSLGAMPRLAYDALGEYADLWATRGVRAWEEEWWSLVSDLGDLVAPLIGARAGEVVFQPNVTLAHAALFSCFDYSRRHRVVTDAMHFPSILYLLDGEAARGAEVTTVGSHDGVTVDTEGILEAIDEDTAFVAISHVLFRSAYIHDVAAITARARGAGALTIVDGYQAVGTLPVDVRQLGVDAYIGGCLKWLCGGPGAAFLWVHPDHHADLTPRLAGWLSHVQPFDFAPQLERRTDAWRFLNGTPNVPSLYAARPGLEIVNRVGVAAIRAKSVRQTAHLVELAAARGWRCTTPADPQRRGGTVAMDVEHGHDSSRALKSRGVLCDYRPGAGIRFSPHFYTADGELDGAVAALDEVLATGAWRRHAGAATPVT